VHCAAADRFHDQVSGALEIKTPLHCCPVALCQLYGVGTAEKVRCMKEIDVKRVALYPFAAVKEAAQGADPLVDDDVASVLHSRTSTHLVSHRADAADASCDVGSFGEAAPHKHGLEIAGRLEDLERHLTHDAVVHLDPQGSLALDA
jgi:hypothetical protein